MKALTIKQPWASLIVEGIKDIENRTWKTNFRGRIYVHAAAKGLSFTEFLWATEGKTFDQSKEDLCRLGNDHSDIIGEVDIIDCIQNHPSIWAEEGVWNWVLANPVKYDKPILNVKGALSFWEYNREAGL